MNQTGFSGLRVLALEARRAEEIAKLIRTYGGEPLVAPAVREVPLESNTAALEFAAGLLAGKFDLVVFFTGVGVRTLFSVVETRYSREEFLAALRKIQIAARGSKTLTALREFNVPVAAAAAEPNTWHELMSALKQAFGGELAHMRVAVQEYGVSNPKMLAALRQATASVTPVPVYQWAMPQDLEPLRSAVQALSEKRIDVLLLTNATQVDHLFQIATQMHCEAALREGLNHVFVVSIGPTTTEGLSHHGIVPDFEPSHPKIGFMVNEAAGKAKAALAHKQNP
jgi:uroporphyrinogen-III synthase